MKKTEASAGARQRAYWSGPESAHWVSLQERYDSLLSEPAARVLEAARLAAGERAADVGCGCGQTTVEVAARVGGEGLAVGVDISPHMLARARHRLGATGRIELVRADQQQLPFATGAFDAVISRFGLTFFSNPEAGLADLRRALTDDGRLAMACWRSPEENEIFRLPRDTIARHIALPPPAPSSGPSPFAFADRVRVLSLLDRAGFRSIQAEPLAWRMTIAKDVDGALPLFQELGIGAALAHVDLGLGCAIMNSLREELGNYLGADGVTLEGAAWLVTARAGSRSPQLDSPGS